MDNGNALYYENLHPDDYHYLVKNSISLIGNSSSGIIETPTLGAYTINIGDRQKGRVKGKSIYDVPCKNKDISDAISVVIKNDIATDFDNPYFKENSSKKAYEITKEVLNSNITIKEFYDINIKN